MGQPALQWGPYALGDLEQWGRHLDPGRTASSAAGAQPITSGAPGVHAYFAHHEGFGPPGPLYRSTDDGATWRSLSVATLPRVSPNWSVITPDGRLLLAYGGPGYDGPWRLLESDAGWTSFSPVDGAQAPPSQEPAGLITHTSSDGYQTLYLSTRDHAFVSTGGARTWVALGAR